MALFQDQSLLRQFVDSGDQRAFETLVQGYPQLVRGAAYRMTGNLNLAEEATQQTFVKLARKARRLTGRQSLAGWLYLTASNEGRHLLRAERMQRAHDTELCQDKDALSKKRDLSEDIRWLSLEKALKSLAEREQDIIARRFFLDQSYDKIAQALEIGEAAARQRLSRALKQLGKRLRERQEATGRLLLKAAAVSLALPPLRLHADSLMIPAEGSATLFGWRFADGLPMANVAIIAISAGAFIFYHFTKPSSENSVQAAVEQRALSELGLSRELPSHDHLVSPMPNRDALLLSLIIDFESRKSWVDHLDLSEEERLFLETEALA